MQSEASSSCLDRYRFIGRFKMTPKRRVLQRVSANSNRCLVPAITSPLFAVWADEEDDDDDDDWAQPSNRVERGCNLQMLH